MGAVFKAEHINMGKVMALKMLLRIAGSDVDSMRRFKLEAKLASQLNHPNIVSIYDFDIENNRAFLVMDYLKGKSLDLILEHDQFLSLERFEHIFLQGCRGFAYAHKNGLVHRDVKLSNLMLIERGGEKDVLVIVDFGLLKVMSKDKLDQRVTENSMIVGSPIYMSPEQCRGETIDQRTDIYSLGCVMYRCLTGEVPFRGATTIDTLRKHIQEQPPPFSVANPKVSVPPALERVVMKALSKKPSDRQQDMTSLADEVTAALKRKGNSSLVLGNQPNSVMDSPLMQKDPARLSGGDSSNTLLIVVVVLLSIALCAVTYQLADLQSRIPAAHPRQESAPAER